MKLLNDNESFSMKSINDNVNEERFIVGRTPREQLAYGVAKKLAVKFDNPKGLKFYYGVALRLPESDIWKHYERANKKGVSNPGGYFTTICNNLLFR